MRGKSISGQSQFILRTKEVGTFRKDKIGDSTDSALDFYKVRIFRACREIEKSTEQRSTELSGNYSQVIPRDAEA